MPSSTIVTRPRYRASGGVWIARYRLLFVCYHVLYMKKEHPKPFMVRLYKADLFLVKLGARKMKVSKAEIIRRAICDYLS